MVEISGVNIALTSGDSLSLRIDLTGRQLPEGSRAVFTLKRRAQDEEVLVQKTLDASFPVLELYLAPQDTALPPRDYCWDLRVVIPREGGGSDVETPMEYGVFSVLQAVGRV